MGGAGGAVSSRGVATALTKLTWAFAVCFIGTSIFLTVIAAQNSVGTSVVDRIGVTPAETETAPATPSGADLLPPGATDATPPRAD